MKEMIVTNTLWIKQGYFAAAVAYNYYKTHSVFDWKLTKSEAKRILKDYHWEYGFRGHTGGLTSDEYYGVETADEWNQIYSEAEKWVEKNYPNLRK